MAFPIRVSDVMSSPVQTATAETTARDAATQCYEEGIGSLVIVEDGEIVGIVTNDDFVHLLGDMADPAKRSLAEFMSRDVVRIDAATTVGDAVGRMFDHGIARLVVFEDEELAGLVSTDDIVHHVPQILQRREFERRQPEQYHYHRSQETAYEKADWEFESVGLASDGVSVGDRIEFTKTISEQDVRSFAAASGDTNRLHLDDQYARETRFGRRIVHGTLLGGLISAALARLPGVTIYLSQDLSFVRPAEVGDRLTAVCEIVDHLGRNKYQLTTDVVDDDEQLISGQAAVLTDAPPDTENVTVEAITTV